MSQKIKNAVGSILEEESSFLSFVLRVKRKIKSILISIDKLVHPVECDSEIVLSSLEKLFADKKFVTIIQVGAHSSITENDPIRSFLEKHSSVGKCPPQYAAILIEPVEYLYKRLVANYLNYSGIYFENIAIAEKQGERNFYRLTEDADPVKYGFPEWANQLGSLLPERMGELWDSYEKDPSFGRFIKENTIVEKVKCATLSEIAYKYCLGTIDLLQIDAEGYDSHIIHSIDFDRIRPIMINYERVLLQKNEPKCRNLLLRQGYILNDHGQDTLAILQQKKLISKYCTQRIYNLWLSVIR